MLLQCSDQAKAKKIARKQSEQRLLPAMYRIFPGTHIKHPTLYRRQKGRARWAAGMTCHRRFTNEEGEHTHAHTHTPSYNRDQTAVLGLLTARVRLTPALLSCSFACQFSCACSRCHSCRASSRAQGSPPTLPPFHLPPPICRPLHVNRRASIASAGRRGSNSSRWWHTPDECCDNAAAIGLADGSRRPRKKETGEQRASP